MIQLISVIVPVFNTSRLYLYECINSILKSSYSCLEILIIDDGSNNETKSICDEIGRLDKRIRVIHQLNGGVSVARNSGIKNANGDYVLFVDSDDTIEPDMIYTLYDLCIKDKLDIAICKLNELHGESVKPQKYTYTQKILKEEDILHNFYLKYDIGWIACGKLIKIEIAKQVFFPEGKKTAEDMYFIWQLCKIAKKIVIYDKPFYNYRKNEQSAMADKNLFKFFDTSVLIDKVWKSENSVDNLFRLEANAFYINNQVWFIRFMIARGAKKDILKMLKELRAKVLKEVIPDSLKYLSKGRKIEYLMLKRTPLFFFLSAKAQILRMKE